MKARSFDLTKCLLLILFILFADPVATRARLNARAQQNSPRPMTLTVSTTKVAGATEVDADTLLYGDLKVYLPDDMAAGDTISGTVVAEPKGNTQEERAKNQDTLAGYVIEIGDQKISASQKNFTLKVPAAPPKTKMDYTVNIIDGSNKSAGSTSLPVAPAFDARLTRPPPNFRLPTIGQQGRSVEIFGPFDGGSENTSLRWRSSTMQDFEKDTENVSGGFGLIAESPRKAVFRSPGSVTGPIEIKLKEGSVETKEMYRNVGVRLSAPKTNLLRGESTTVTIEVRGLDGIKKPVPLQLDSKGVISMEGGNFQNLRILPTEIRPDGRYVTTRAITGQQAGGFTVTATVVVRPFDTCLQDDKVAGTVLLWNTFTGDYRFMCSAGCMTGDASISLTGLGKPVMKGCIITLEHNAPDRRVFARLNACDKSGDAAIQMSSPKASFAITDRNITDNTCATPPPSR